jgi:predicted  nucleic acid-binding Zn-ribbon protein
MSDSEADEVDMKRSDQGRALDTRLKEAEKKIADLLRELEEIQRKINLLSDVAERGVLSEQFQRLVDAFVGSNRATPKGPSSRPNEREP